MQKVVGSNPISRFAQKPRSGGAFVCLHRAERSQNVADNRLVCLYLPFQPGLRLRFAPSVCDVLNYIGQHLLVPILVTVVGGALIASARRYFRLDKEVTDNDARASELNEDLWRWVRDRNRQLENELRGLVNGAGNQLYAGSLRNKAVAAMRQALHEYRDEATSKAREFSALARSEGRWHRGHRERRGFGPPSLGLRGQECLSLNSWRQRPYLVDPGGPEPDLAVDDDPTADEPSIASLETESGLTWAEAAARRSI